MRQDLLLPVDLPGVHGCVEENRITHCLRDIGVESGHLDTVLVPLLLYLRHPSKRKNNLLDALEAGAISFPDLAERMGEVKKELQAIEDEMTKLESTSAAPPPIELWDIVELRAELLEMFKGDGPSPLAAIAKGFIQNIKVFNDHLEIEYRWKTKPKKIGLLRTITKQSHDVYRSGAEDSLCIIDLSKNALCLTFSKKF